MMAASSRLGFVKNILPVLVLVPLGIYFLQDTFTLFPSFIHAWTQSDRYALALGFLKNGFDFFHPQTFNLDTVDGITAVDFPIHEYIVALLMKLTGVHEPVVFRIYMFCYGVAGLVFLFRIAELYTGSFLKGIFTAFFLLLCPVFLYYLDGFIPSIPSLSNTFIGYYFYFRYKKSGNGGDIKKGLLFLTLAALSRQPFFIFLFAVFCQEFFLSLKKKVWPRMIWGPMVGAFLFFFGYQFYNYLLREKYGSQFLGSFLSAKDYDQFKETVAEAWMQWKLHYFSLAQYIILGILLLVLLSRIFVRRDKDNFHKSFQFQFLIAFSGTILYFILMVRQFPDHDYYFIDSFYAPLMLAVILMLGTDWPVRWLNYGLLVLLAIFLFRAGKETRETMKQRYETYPWDRVEVSRQNFLGAGKFLDSLGISRDAKVMVPVAHTSNIPFILMDRQGWALVHMNKSFVDTILSKPFDIAALQNSFVVSDMLQKDFSLTEHLEKFADNGKVGFYRRKSIPGQTLEQFAGISEKNILWKDSVRFANSDSSAHEADKSLSVPVSRETVDLVSNPGLKISGRPLKVLVRGKIKLDNDDAPSLISSFSNGDSVYYYQSFDLGDYLTSTGEWQELMFQFVVPAEEVPGRFVVYFWNNRHGEFMLDEITVTAYQ